MISTLAQVFPLILFFFIGYIFRLKFKYPEEFGQVITRIILNITLPVTLFLSFISNVRNIGEGIYLPLVALAIQLILFGLAYIVTKKTEMDIKTECVFITSPLITNTMLFLSSYFYLVYGDYGLTRLGLYDIGNSITIYFIAQTLFASYENKKFNIKQGVKTLLTSAPIWAIVGGLIIGWLGIVIPEMLLKPLKIIREVNTFLPMFALGFYFKPILDGMKLVMGTIFLKMVLGLILGVGFAMLFGGTMDKITIIMSASAPVGIISLVFASIYDKDTKFASNLVSYSIAFGIVLLMILNYSFTLFGWNV